MENRIIIDGSPRPRARVRRWSEDEVRAIADEMAREVLEPGTPPARICVAHAGDVSNSYGYSTGTEVQVRVAVRCIDGAAAVRIWRAEAPANKVTLAAALAHCVGGRYRAVADARYGAPKVAEARMALADLAAIQLGVLPDGALDGASLPVG